MGVTNYPNGIASFGIPVLPAADHVSTGPVFFVCSVNGSNGNSGAKPSEPLATVDSAIGLCPSNKGSKIYLMEGHAETVTATSIALDVAGIKIVGCGEGLLRPTFTYGAAAATITVSAANCSWSGCHFIANFADVAAAFTLGAAKDFKLDHSSFVDTSSILNFLSIVVTGSTNNAADGLKVRDNFVTGLAATDGAVISVLGNLSRLQAVNNYVDKAATNDAGHFLTASSKVLLYANISGNRMAVVGATNAAVGIFLTGSGTTSTGWVNNNYVASLDTTTELIATAGTGLKYIENYYTGTADISGKLWPVVDGA